MTEEKLTQEQLREKILPLVPPALDAEAAVSGVAAALYELERPMERGLFGDRHTLYAWRSEDVPFVESGLSMLGELVENGFVSPKFLATSLVELVKLWVLLRKERSAIRDPGMAAVLLLLKSGPRGGMSESDLVERLTERSDPPIKTRKQVEEALDKLARPNRPEQPHALVENDGSLWKSLV